MPSKIDLILSEAALSLSCGLMPHRGFNHISFELSAKIGFSPVPIRSPPIPAGRPSKEWRMSFEANKIAAAMLVALILAMVSGILAEKLVKPTMLAKNVYEVAGVPQKEEGSAAAKPAGPEPIGPLLAAASPDAGKSDVKLCAACHTFDKGGPNRVGPNLYGILGDEIAHDRGNYDFSAALKKAGEGKTWTPDLLNAWLYKPQDFAKGTKMTFAGVDKPKDRADIVAYLNSLSDAPKPLAAAPGGGEAKPAAPGGGEAKPAAPGGGEAKPAAASPTAGK
jgi:cytochrome c